MNLMEFLFALTAVFGSTAVVTLWQYLMYKLDIEEESKDKNIRLIKQRGTDEQHNQRIYNTTTRSTN